MPAKKEKIKVMIVDDHPLVREGVRSCLKHQPQFEIVGEAAGGEDAVLKAKKLAPDVVLMDINMPGVNGLESATELIKKSPKSKVLIFTMHDSKEYIVKVIEAGMKGFVLKDSSPTELIAAIEAVSRGEVYFSSKVSQFVMNDYIKTMTKKASANTGNLSKRELEVIVLIAEGQSNKDIALKLFISIRTVETHRERIMRKLGIHTVAGLTRYAISNGLLTT
jgi:two-component system nitrate/nitrite response regulator NarL